MPVWNRVDPILMAVESGLRQSVHNLGLLMVGDGTIDALAGIPDPRQRCFVNPHNTGIRAARSQWVAFQNSDNEWLPQKLEKQIALLVEAGPDVVVFYTGMTIIGRSEQRRGGRAVLAYISGPEELFVEGDLLARSFFRTQMFRAHRSALLEAGGFEEALATFVGWDCVIWLAQRGHFGFAEKPLIVENFFANNISFSRIKRLRAHIRIVEKYATRPRIPAEHNIAIMGVQRRIGDLAAACASLAVARRFHPRSLLVRLRKLWLIVLFLLLQKRPAKGS